MTGGSSSFPLAITALITGGLLGDQVSSDSLDTAPSTHQSADMRPLRGRIRSHLSGGFDPDLIAQIEELTRIGARSSHGSASVDM